MRSKSQFAAGCAALALAALSTAPVHSQQGARSAGAQYSKSVPPVVLSAGHQALCKVTVGDAFPPIELPKLDGAPANIAQLAGKQATVVCFWTDKHWMSRAALRDLTENVAKEFAAPGVSIVGVAVGLSPEEAKEAGASFLQLVDAQGKGLAQVGVDALPRLYVLDPQQRIAWFDIEYSEATRRELRKTLTALTKAR